MLGGVAGAPALMEAMPILTFCAPATASEAKVAPERRSGPGCCVYVTKRLTFVSEFHLTQVSVFPPLDYAAPLNYSPSSRERRSQAGFSQRH
jgi:hypothetical protein